MRDTQRNEQADLFSRLPYGGVAPSAPGSKSSREMADEITPRIGSLHALVLSVMALDMGATAGSIRWNGERWVGGCTRSELALLAELKENTVNARVAELIAMGKVVEHPTARRMRRSVLELAP